MLNINSLFKRGRAGTLFSGFLNQSQNDPLGNVISRRLEQRFVASVLLSLIVIVIFLATSHRLYAASLTVNTVNLYDETLAESDYLVNFNTFSTDHSLRYCIDTYISSDFYLIFSLSNDAVWENAQFSSSLSIEGSTVSHALIEGGSKDDNFVKFLIHSDKESISSGTCFVIGKNTDNIIRLPEDIPSGTRFQIQVETQLASNPNIVIEPIETADWVVIRSQIDCETVTTIPQNECEALVELYYATNGPDWTDRAINKWNLTNNPCIWAGISCTDGHVTRIRRTDKNLVGTLPKFSAFNNLQIFDLAANQLSGSMPSDLNALTQLQEFNLWGNELTGPIPNLSALTDLQKLKLGGGNQLSGPIPDFSTLSNLVDLGLGGNQLTGNIPKLSALTQLEIVNLGNNQLSGAIPDLSALRQLKILHLQNNQLSGTIPDLKNLTQLQELYLQNNQFHSEIPSSLIHLTQLKDSEGLNLNDNALTTTDAELVSFLNEANPGWAETQTIPPTLIEAKVHSSTEIEILWEPIPYTDNIGYYQVKYATEFTGPYEKAQTRTNNKKANSDIVTDLSPNTTYYFRVETYTQAHGDQKNDLTSVLSETLSAHTLSKRAPEIDVLDNNAKRIVNGSLIDFGTRVQGSDAVKTFIVKNSGEIELELSQPILNGIGFRETTDLNRTTLEPGESTRFTIRLETNRVDSFNGEVLLNNTDSDENPFKIVLKGTVIPLSNEGNCEKQKEIQKSECDALVRFYHNTNGLNWADSPYNQWNDWYASNAPCNWKGVTCTNGRVRAIERSHQNLEGTLPDLTPFNRLHTVLLDNNQLTGPIPDLTPLLSLERLNLEANQLTGKMPDLSELDNLKELNLGKNQLSGSIPENLGNLVDLNRLHLDNNQLSGAIPPSLVQLTELQAQDGLDLRYNKLTTGDAKLIQFLNAKNQGWNKTQTIPPPIVMEPIVLSETEVQLRWASIPYQEDGGYYQIKYTTESSDEYTIEKTADKKTTSHIVKNLLPNTTYIFVVETHTPAHSDQQNALTSKPSKELKARTTEQRGPLYASTPQPNTLLDMGSSELGTPSTTTATLIVLNQGDKLLEVSESRISGAQANDFRIKSGAAPFSLSDSNTEHALVLECTPSKRGVQTAILTLKTTDPNHLTVSYPLTCRTPGQETGKPVYDSLPKPNLPLMMGSDELGHPISSHLTILELGTATLDVTASSLTGPHASDFSIVAGNAPFSIRDNDAPHTLFLHCLPSAIGKRTADLTLMTNDPEQITVKYRLQCEGIGPIYESQPEPGTTLSLGSDDDRTLNTMLTVSNSGNSPLKVLESEISGNHESDFSISRGAAPFSIAQGDEPHTLNIQCFSNQNDERTGTLTLTTNDRNQPTVTYPLSCFGKGIGPVYASEPQPNSTLALGTAGIDTSITTDMIISEMGDESLEVSSIQISGQHQDDFSLLNGNEILNENQPFSIADGDSPFTLTIKCTPREKGERTATLILRTNDPNQSIVLYPLSCLGTNLGPIYASDPEPNTTLNIGTAIVNSAITTELLISETGNETLELSELQISGQHQDDFSLLNENEMVSENQAFSIADGDSSLTLAIKCTPREKGERTATLSLKTNDPNQSSVTYPVNCLGTSIGPIYASEPEPNTILTIGNAIVNTPITTELIISEAGNETLQVSEPQISGQHQDDFSLLSGNQTVSENDQLSLPDGAASQSFTVRCTPSDIGDRSATLSFSTNDPNQPQVRYPLTCQGLVDEARFTGEIHTQFDIVGNTITIDSPEQIKLIGRIQPAKQHIGQQANLFFRYQWTPQNGGNSLNLNVTLAEQQVLEEEIEMTLFEGRLIGLTGVFKIDLGYELPNDEVLFDEIVTLTVRPNTEPSDLILEGNTVQENSPANTVIGTFSTEDADKGDWFVYGLIENPNKSFKIVGNELRVSKKLDFDIASEYSITVRSVDNNGSYQEKSFLISVTQAQANPIDIHLTEDSVLENTPSDTIIGRFWTEDVEQGNYDYELLEDAEGYFMLDALENNLLRLAPGKPLDFETQAHHNITVRSTERQIGASLEKTFSINLINVADVIVQGEIRDALNDSLIESPISPTEDIKFNVQLIPDKAHHGQEAEIICMALYLINQETQAIYVLEGEQWEEWNDNLSILPSVTDVTLQDSHNLSLWEGQFTQKEGQLNLYVGYRLLETGEFVYSPEGFEITFEE